MMHRLSPGQAWFLIYKDQDDPDLPFLRNNLFLLIRWDVKKKQWWVLRTYHNGRIRYYPSSVGFTEFYLNDAVDSHYEFHKVA